MADVMFVLRGILPHLIDIGDSDDDLYEEEEDILLLLSGQSSVQNDRVCIRNYVESVVRNYRPCDFKSHFRFKRTTFERVLIIIEPQLSISSPSRPAVSAEKQLLYSIWILTNQETFRSVADRFDLSKSTLSRILGKVCQVLCDTAPGIIYSSSAVEAERNFKAISGFPGVIGAVDGTHIGITPPHVAPQMYLNRNQFFSVILQAVANSDLSFTHITCSFPGSVHDARVFHNSEVNHMCGNQTYFPDNTHIIGDAANPFKVNLLTSYKNNGHLGRRQLNYNKKLSMTRVCVEQAFGQLKGRFRRLKHFDVSQIELIPMYVLASCVLNNICIRADDMIHYDPQSSDDDPLYSDRRNYCAS